MQEGLILSDRYQLVESLGSGGMGSVWRATDLRLGGEVAVKLMDSELVHSNEALARFRREAQAAAAIRSTYVVQIFDYGVDAGNPYIAMELLRGESLATRLKRVGRLKPGEVGHVLGHVGRALALAHSKGIVHRDLKPENIFLAREGEEDVGKVLDFGIARNTGAFATGGDIRTRTGTVLGTPFYMSAEQVSGQHVNHLTDIWSFGVIAYECLLGRHAFDGQSFVALYERICLTELPVPSASGVVPPGFDGWFARAVKRDRRERYQSIQEAADDLRALCGSVSLAPPRSLRSSTSTVPLRPSGAAGKGASDPNAANAASYLAQNSTAFAHAFQRLVRRQPRVAIALALSVPVLVGSFALVGVRGLIHHRVHGSVKLEPSLATAVPPPSRTAPTQTAPLTTAPLQIPSAVAVPSGLAPSASAPYASASSATVTPAVPVGPQVFPVSSASLDPSAVARSTKPSVRLPAAKSTTSATARPQLGEQTDQQATRPRRNVSGI